MVIEFACRIPTGNESVYRFILDHHHRMNIHCFPITQTKVYFIISIALQSLGFFTFMIMEFGKDFGHGDSILLKFMIALFHSGSCRSSGFTTINIAELSFVTLTIYILMMRIKPQMFCDLKEKENEFRQIAADDYRMQKVSEAAYQFEEEKFYEISTNDSPLTRDSFLYTAIDNLKELTSRKFIQTFGESWLEAFNTFFTESINHLSEPNAWLGIVLLMIVGFERDQLYQNNTDFTYFKVFFEVASVFGNVGLSLGYPGLNASFCAMFSLPSKILIILVMILSRHRGFFGAMEDQNVDFVIDI
jgi:hypothetical protein